MKWMVVDVYRLPAFLGGSWCFTAGGVISDGYDSLHGAKEAAQAMLRADGWRGPICFEVEADE